MSVKARLGEHAMLIFLILLVAGAMLFVDRFNTSTNFFNILSQVAINAIIATGMTYVILTGGIDLSVGSVAALAGVTVATIIREFPYASVGFSILVAITTAIVVGVIFGSFTAFSIAKLKVPPFIATLAMMSIARGIAFIHTQARPVAGLPRNFTWLGSGRLGGVVPISALTMAIIMAAAYIVLSRTCYGRHIYAIGSNEEVSKLSGIRVAKVKASVYIISGIMASLGGILLASRLLSGNPSAAPGAELEAIAAVAIGGTSMSGGKGGILQTLQGVLLIGVINNILSLMRVDSHFQTVVMGLIILVAVIIDQAKN